MVRKWKWSLLALEPPSLRRGEPWARAPCLVWRGDEPPSACDTVFVSETFRKHCLGDGDGGCDQVRPCSCFEGHSWSHLAILCDAEWPKLDLQ